MSDQKEETNIQIRKLVATIGLILMAASLFLPWITATATIFGTNLSAIGFELSTEISFFAIMFLLIGSLMVWMRNNHKQNGIVCMLMASLMGIEIYLLHIELQHRVETISTGLILTRIGSGFYLLALGALLTFVGGILLATLLPETHNTTTDQQTTETNKE